MRRRNADSKSRADSGGSERVDRSSQKVPLLGVQMNHFDRKWEREGLFCYANCLRQKQDMWKFGQAEFDKYVRPMLDSEGEVGVEDDIKALVQLGIHLCPSFGSLRFLPQFDPCWITFRRLFLRLTAPDNTNRPVFLPEDEVADRPLRFCGGHPDQSDDSGSLQPVGDDDPCKGIGNYFLEWENKFEPNLDRLRVLVEQRLASDSRISLSVAKDTLVDAGEFILGPEYGFLWHVVNEFNELEQPVWRSRNLADSKNGETTEGFLRKCVSEVGKIGIDFDDELKQAQRSVRAFLFDLAIERVVGRMGFESTKVFDLEKESLRRRLLDDPYGILKDGRLAEYVADQLAFDGLSFSRSLVNHLSNRKKGSDVRHWRERWKVKVIFAQMWTHPELPLWVMESPALSATFTKCLPTGLSQYVSKESLRENWKPSRSRFAVIPRSQLKRSSKLLISKILFDFAEEDGNQKIVIEEMDIHGKLKCSSAWEEYNRNFNNKHVQ